LKDLSNREVSLDLLERKAIVLVFGELYQPNTQKALADLKQVYEDSRFTAEEVGVLVIITEKKKRKAHLKTKEKLKIPFSILLDEDKSVYGQYGVIAIPTTFLIGRAGKVRHVFASYTFEYYDQMNAELTLLTGRITEEQYEGLKEPDTQTDEQTQKAQRLVSLADRLSERGFLESAEDSYRQAIQLKPDMAKAHAGLGTVYLQQGKLEEAEREFQAALEKDPELTGATKGIARLLIEQGKQEEAETHLKRLVEQGHAEDDTYFLLGQISEKRGNCSEALSYYKKSSEQLLKERGRLLKAGSNTGP
jgi:tetratricopeptide (TPR) repeat protein